MENACFGVPWGELGAALGSELVTGGDHFSAIGPLGGSWAAFGVPLGCSWGDFGGQKGDQGGPKAGHRAIWGSKGPLEGSCGHFGGGFGIEKGSF